MVEKLSCYFLDNVLYKNEEIEGDQRDIMLFGITRIIEDIPKYIGIILISYLLNILPQVGIVIAVTITYKFFLGSAHARTNLMCFLSSLAFFILPVYIAKYVNVSNTLLYSLYAIVFIFSIYIIIKHAPADTEEVPILNKVKRKRYKYFALIVLLVHYAIALFLVKEQIISKIIITSVLFTDIFATNLFYKLYKCKHSYESEEFKEFYNK